MATSNFVETTISTYSIYVPIRQRYSSVVNTGRLNRLQIEIKTIATCTVPEADPGVAGKQYSSTLSFQYFTYTQCGTRYSWSSLYHTCMTYMHDKEHIPLLRGTFRALPLERLNFVESRATDENFARNLGISQVGLLNRCVSSVV